MPTTFATTNRRPAYVNKDGLETIPRAADEVDVLTIDWADRRENAETISSATWSAHGVTATGSAISGTKTYATISGTDGDLQVKIVTSLARTLIKTIRFQDSGDIDL